MPSGTDVANQPTLHLGRSRVRFRNYERDTRMAIDVDHTADASNLVKQTRDRLPRLILPLGVALILLVAAVITLISFTRSPSPPETAQAAGNEVEPALTPTVPASRNQSPVVVPRTAPDSAETPAPDIVAVVNGQSIRRPALQTMQSADRAMMELLGRQASVDDDVLDRLVNGALVQQAADQAGFALREGDVERELLSFLHARNKSMADLENALAANDLDVEAFKGYYAQLLLVNQFSQAQAERLGVSVSAYLRRLQRASRISFGPAADEVLAQALPETAQPTPPASAAEPSAPKAEVVASSPAESSSSASIPDGPRGTARGQYAPRFDLPALNDPQADVVTLEDLAGKPTLLSFWTTWCPYCRAQTPVLVAAHEKYVDRVQFAGINVKESQQPVENYIQAHDMRYPIGLDRDGQIAGQYGVSGFPTTYFLDAEGRVVARHVGQLSTGKLESYLQQLLKTNDS